jgi:mannose-6-phosphate isomerase-like protein (cupin superfamily)
MTLVHNVAAAARFSSEKLAKVTLHSSGSMLLGLNCLESGQSQLVHAHAGADKFYYVCSGRARFVLGDATVDAGPGDVVVCPAGEPHGIETALERTTLLVGIAPWKGPLDNKETTR